MLGYYQPWNREIVIYVDNSLSILEIITVVLHEFVHHCQMISKKDQKKYYDKLLTQGYFFNTYEVEARKLSKKYRNQCYDQIIKNVVRD